MILELLVGAVMVLVTVIFHGLGLLTLARVTGPAARAIATSGPVSFAGFRAIVALVLGLFVLHGLEIWSYALLYTVIGAIPDLREAVYFSTSTFAAIGFDDAPIDPHWILLAGIEGINGVILLGWSVAFMATAMERLRAPPHRASPPRS